MNSLEPNGSCQVREHDSTDGTLQGFFQCGDLVFSSLETGAQGPSSFLKGQFLAGSGNSHHITTLLCAEPGVHEDDWKWKS
jgi:hypothetical protein